MQLLFDDRNQHIGAHGAPDLGLYGVLAGAKKVLDAQVLLDPFEKQFDLPAAFVKIGNGGGWQHRVVGKKDQRFVGGGVFESDAPNSLWINYGRVVALEHDPLIGNHSARSVGRIRVEDKFGIHGDCGFQTYDDEDYDDDDLLLKETLDAFDKDAQ